jgi:hypothetical protein
MEGTSAVRVAIRVRPLLDSEKRDHCTECIRVVPNEPQVSPFTSHENSRLFRSHSEMINASHLTGYLGQTLNKKTSMKIVFQILLMVMTRLFVST